MIQIIMAFVILIFLCILGWSEVYSLNKNHKSIISLRPSSHKKKYPAIVNNPQKVKDNRDDSR
jgi:hypothetical protein